MTGARARGIALALVALGGLLGLIASSQTWWRLVVTAPGQSIDPAQGVITGSTASAGLSQVLPGCVLVAGLLTLVLRGVAGRRVVAVLTGLLGLGVAVLGGWHPQPDQGTVAETLRRSSLADSASLAGTVWPWLYLLAGLLAVAGAALIVGSAPSWPRRADRYAVSPDGVPAARVSEDPETWWKAMDAGVDPTATGAAVLDSPISDSPISEEEDPGATMGSTQTHTDTDTDTSGSER